MAITTDAFTSYMSARIRGMRSALLSRSDMEALIERGDSAAIAEQLLTSPYENEMSDALSDHEGANAVETAVTQNLVNTFAKLRRVGGGDQEALVALFLARWDLTAVKSLLRNRHHELDEQTGRDSLVPGPSLPMSALTELAAHDTMDALVRALASWNSKLCRRLPDALSKYQDSRDLRVLEEALDKAYFVDNMRTLASSNDPGAKFMVDLLRAEIDRINLRLVFSPRAEGVTPEDVVSWTLPRGYVDQTTLREIASAPSPDRAASVLDRTPYAKLEGGLEALSTTGKFARTDREFEQAFFERLRRGVQAQAIGLPILLLFAWQKYSEVTRIRMLSRGLAAGVPVDYLREEVLGG